MGSACIPWLCLLLALPTPHAGVAVPRANLAEGAGGSPVIKTTVTVYYCKDCERERCTSSNYADFEIIGKTENEIFSNERIQLVTNETHITMCFQQGNMYRDGAYVIFWEKDGGLGEPCGILKFGDRRHSMTEEEKICCETQTDHANPHNVLKCYIGATDKKNTNTRDDITAYGDLGNNQYSVGENNQTGLAATFLILGICAGGAALLSVYFYKRRIRRHQGHITEFLQTPPGEENKFIEWSTDIISVWEGDSINVTCSKNSSENELGTYLRTRMPPANIVYVSTKNTSYIHPDFANRTKYLKEGTNLTITVHNVQKSDSNIYQCSSYIKKNDHHFRRDGKSVIVIVKAKANGVIEQSPLSVSAQQGESINITCVLTSSHEDEGIMLLKIHMQVEKVLYVSSQNTSTIFPTFANRLEYSKQEKKLVITLHDLQENDTDIYVCAAVLKNSPLSVNESGTMVLVKGGKQTECSISSLAIYIPTIVLVLLLSALICYVLNRINVKKFFQKKKRNVVYEDMSFSSRSNTLVRTNTYSANN